MTTQNPSDPISTVLAEMHQLLRQKNHEFALAMDAAELIAVSKRQPIERLKAALSAGHRVFGENQIQESIEKWPPLKEIFPEVRLHLIGPLQSNKTKEAVALFDMIHTVDREKIALSIDAECRKQQKDIPCLIQVNTGEEPQKAGIHPIDLPDFLDFCANETSLAIEGLMCIPPAEDNPAPHFALMHELKKRHGLKKLSMGMSGDYEEALRFGSNYVRLGTAIFGQRTN